MTDHRFFVRLNGKKQYGYGAYHADFALFDSLWIKNETEYVFSDLSVRVRTEPNVLLQGDGKLDFLPAGGYRAMSCDFIQGYYYSKPLPPEEFVRFVGEHNRAA